MLILSGYPGADGVKTVLDVLVATVNLVDMVDFARSFGTHGGDEHRNTGTDIGAGHVVMLELACVVVPDDNRPVRVTEDDLRPHINEFVHKEEAAFEHLLMNQHTSPRLR